MVENNQSDISIDVFNNLSKDYNLIPIFKILDKGKKNAGLCIQKFG